jgi:large subunit ribosomal protein L31e
MAEKTTQELERIYTIPLREVKSSPRNHQADRAIRAIKRYLTRHMKSEDIWIDASVNEAIWARGMYTIPSRIRVRARKFDDGVVEVSLPDVEAKASIRADLKARKEKKDEEKKKAEKKAEEKGEGEAKEAAAKAPAKKPPRAERKVIDIEGVGPKFEADLAKAGVKVMDDLLARDAAELAQATGISESLIKTWQGMADMDRLDTVNNQYAEVLVRAGIDRVEQLAKETPEAVVTRINGYLATLEKRPTDLPVNETMAGEWVAEARRVAQADKAAAKKPAGKA